MPYRVGILSDTHGLLRPEAILALGGSDYILHAGDVGDPAILTQLRQIAPLTAIRGNIDGGAAFADVHSTEAVELCGKLFYLVHSIHDLQIKPASAGVAVVVSGHSHKPGLHEKEGVLYLNPGSAGPRRFSLPISLATAEIEDDRIVCRIIELQP